MFDDADYGNLNELVRNEEMNRFGFQEMEKTGEYVETQWYKETKAKIVIVEKQFYTDYL
jgi:hypothetical protein